MQVTRRRTCTYAAPGVGQARAGCQRHCAASHGAVSGPPSSGKPCRKAHTRTACIPCASACALSD